MKILDRYILKEFLAPFFFGLGTFTVLFIAVESLGGLAKMISESDLPLIVVAEFVVVRLPQVLIFTLPMSCLLACLLAYGRMSGDSELIALSACGVSFFRMALPVLALCASISLGSQWMNEHLAPQGLRRAFDILLLSQVKSQELATSFASRPRRLKNGESMVYYAHHFETANLTITGLTVEYFDSDDRLLRLIHAREAVWNGQHWELHDMMVETFDESGQTASRAFVPVGGTRYGLGFLPQPGDITKRKFRPEEMSRRELREWFAQRPTPQEVPDDPEFAKDYYDAWTTYHQKVAVPWTSFVFSTFAIPLGVRPQRSSKSIGFGLSLLFILAYYILMTIGMLLGGQNIIPPFIGAWLPNILFAGLGMVLLYRATKK